MVAASAQPSDATFGSCAHRVTHPQGRDHRSRTRPAPDPVPAQHAPSYDTLVAMASGTAWWLNLDAERELANPDGYRPDPRIQARIRERIPQLSSLLGSHGRVIGEHPIDPGQKAQAWCPTPTALHGIAEAGLTPPPHPPLEVLQRVNHRGFCASLGQTLPGAQHVDDMHALEACILQPSATGDWVIKGPFGFAGRDRRRAIGGQLDASTEGFARGVLARGETLQVEPWMPRVADVAIHAWLEPSGRVHLAAPIAQHCDSQGRYQSSAGPAEGALPARLVEALRREALHVGKALRDAGYFGPFGVDAYTYLDAARSLCFNPRSEINARFTMGYRWPPHMV